MSYFSTLKTFNFFLFILIILSFVSIITFKFFVTLLLIMLIKMRFSFLMIDFIFMRRWYCHFNTILVIVTPQIIP